MMFSFGTGCAVSRLLALPPRLRLLWLWPVSPFGIIYEDDAIHNAAKSGDSVKVEALLNGKADLIASKNGNGLNGPARGSG